MKYLKNLYFTFNIIFKFIVFIACACCEPCKPHILRTMVYCDNILIKTSVLLLNR